MKHKPYSKTVVLRALLLAPLPGLLGILMLSTAANGSDQFTSLVSIVFVTALVYAVYCILALPFAYSLSQLVQLRFQLTLGIILPGSIVVWLIMFSLLQLVLDHQISMSEWSLYLSGGYYIIALLTGLFYWLFLRYFAQRASASPALFNKLKLQ